MENNLTKEIGMSNLTVERFDEAFEKCLKVNAPEWAKEYIRNYKSKLPSGVSLSGVTHLMNVTKGVYGFDTPDGLLLVDKATFVAAYPGERKVEIQELSLTAKETAVILRKAIKKAFPGKKFSVRLGTGTASCHIHVTAPSGVDPKEVNEILNPFDCFGFDDAGCGYSKRKVFEWEGAKYVSGASMILAHFR